MIPVTKPFLPPIVEYQDYLADIWQRNWLTNNGPLVNELELKLKEHLDVPHCLYLGNGTIAIQIAIKALELSGEVITTPFSYIATTSCIVWEHCKPIFVDINPNTLNIDVSKIESAITQKTTGIIATHVYGNACDISAISDIAQKHNLKVIYDAAHCFGTFYKGKSIFSYGDVSTTSFHATKLFHTIEGGAVFTSHPEILKKMAFMRNFGHNGPENFETVGINGKNSEVHAAMGLVNLRYIENILKARKNQYERYFKWLCREDIKRITINKDCQFNYAYLPLIFESEAIVIKLIDQLNANLIYPRRYFFPSINNVEIYLGAPMPVSEDISKRILCLPLYHSLSLEEIDFVCRIVLRALNN